MTPAASVARRLRRHWALAAVCAFFLLAGALTLDDYGIGNDEWGQRAIGMAALDYLAGEGEGAINRLPHPPERYYGAAFEVPLVLLTERILGLEDSRDVFLARHLLTHLFFLAGGVFCYLLVYRLFGSRALALIATVLFLLHPRIYAHSFYNSKDIPFLVAFMVSLYLLQRAFRRETLAAFLLCGVGVGLLVNLRVMGLLLFAAVLVLRALDLAVASSREERKRVLRTGGAFALAAVLAYYASLPILWTDPAGRFVDLLSVLSTHPVEYHYLFRGEWLYAPNGPPPAYVPVWVGITTPPATLLLAATGALALAWRGLRRPREALRDNPTRFGLLLVAIPVVMAVAVVVLENNVYTGWRQLYFLYAPLLLLAVFGLHWLASSAGRWPRAGAYALAGAALAVTVVSLARIHPHQGNYFTALADRAAPEGLSSRYELDYWRQSYWRLVGNVLDAHPSASLRLRGLRPGEENQRVAEKILPADDRERIVPTENFRSGDVNLYRLPRFRACPHAAPGTYFVGVYGTTIECMVDPVAWFGGLRREALGSEPLVRSRFDAHRVGNLMVYVRDGCSREDMDARIFLRVYPVDPGDPFPHHLREFFGHPKSFGFEKGDFDFHRFGARIDGDCVAVVPLPAWPIARIETGLYTVDWAGAAWRAVAEAEPLTRARFDLYLDERTLTYVREACSAEDADARFFLHVHPTDIANLPERRKGHGFDNLNFDLREQGARTDDGACVAVVHLPAYPITHIHTGQLGADESSWWDARFAFSLPEVDPSALAGEPLARGVFGIWLDGEALVYAKDACAEEEAESAFFLHLHPVNAADLPVARREHGFDNRDFFLWERGGRVDGRCLAVAPLPGYPIARVETGQYDGAGRRWTAEFALPR